MRSCLLLTFFPSKTVWAEPKSATVDLVAIHWHRDAGVPGTFAIGESNVGSTLVDTSQRESG